MTPAHYTDTFMVHSQPKMCCALQLTCGVYSRHSRGEFPPPQKKNSKSPQKSDSVIS